MDLPVVVYALGSAMDHLVLAYVPMMNQEVVMYELHHAVLRVVKTHELRIPIIPAQTL